MWNYLRTLQQKPYHERKIAAYVLTVILFVLLVFLWVLFLNIEKAKKNNTSSLESIVSPFESVKDILTGIFDGTQTVEFPAFDISIQNNTTSTTTFHEVGTAESDMFTHGTTTEQVASSTLKIGTTTPKASLPRDAGASTSQNR